MFHISVLEILVSSALKYTKIPPLTTSMGYYPSTSKPSSLWDTVIASSQSSSTYIAYFPPKKQRRFFLFFFLNKSQSFFCSNQLPMSIRGKFKILTLTQKALYNLVPWYLYNIICYDYLFLALCKNTSNTTLPLPAPSLPHKSKIHKAYTFPSIRFFIRDAFQYHPITAYNFPAHLF